ncbi:MAG: hypothetical protein IJI44_04640 [Erysipelotrichaceae bacterium]|nr:hypothetical protein [Erysipelotrichaceae bacterium]
MDNENSFYTIMRGVFAGCGVLFVLLLALFLLTSLTTGQSLFAPEIVQLFVTLFQISTAVFGGLAVFMLFLAVFTKKKNPALPGSMVVKDNVLKYEYIDENGRKKKKTFSLKNIDAYLNERGSMDIILDAVLSKNDPKEKPNIRSLMIQFPKKEKKSLAILYKEDPDTYNRIASFLDRISVKDVRDLQDHLPRYVHQQDLLDQGEDLVRELKRRRMATDDSEVKAGIDAVNDRISEMKTLILEGGNNDKLRKLYSYYVPMLTEIIDNFVTIESHEGIENDPKAKEKLMQTFDLIGAAFETLRDKQKEDEFDQLEATAQTIEALLKQEKNG